MEKQTHHPPKWASQFLTWFCAEHLLEAIEGDLFELYEKRAVKKGKTIAKFFFILDVMSVCRPFAFRKKRSHSNNIAMLNNYFKVAFRNLLRHRLYSFIKIGGFGLGIAVCILIALFVNDELSFDQHYEKGPQIYRLINQFNDPEKTDKWPAFQAPAANVVKSEIPEIDKIGRLIPYKWFDAGNNLFRTENGHHNSYETGFVYADQEFIDIIELPFESGDPESALTEPKSIIISARKAQQYFPNGDAIGKIIFLNDEVDKPFKISGVMKDLPSNTHFEFEFIITLSQVEFWPGEQTSWCCNNYHTYARLLPNADKKDVEEKLVPTLKNHLVPYFAKRESKEEMAKMEAYIGFELQPISDIHLRSGDIIDFYDNGDIEIVLMFGLIAILILILACINFINLSTAKSANRAKEVGLRKVVGSGKGSLISQFLTESIIYSFISFILGLVLAWIALPYFNILAEKSLVIPIDSISFISLFIFSIFLIGSIAGLYPAFYLSSFRPIAVIKGNLSLGSKSSKLRDGLVVFQFAVSVILIIGALVVNGQMDYMLNKKLGFTKEQVVLLQGTNTLGDQINVFKDELKKLHEVKNVTVTQYFPVSDTKRDRNMFWKEGKRKIESNIGAQSWFVDEDYVATLNMEIIAGRNFSSTLASDSNAIIINEAMAKALGFEDPLGKRISNGNTLQIVGVVKNFHYESMTTEIQPLVLNNGYNTRMMGIKIGANDIPATLAAITKTWDQLKPKQPIRYQFMDDKFEIMYSKVGKTGLIFTIFASFAVFIACLGLFALTAFMIEQRRKEISIRKVLGASFKGLFSLLSLDYLKLIFISLFLALPIGWYLMQNWLENYEYKTNLSWSVLAVAAIVISLISIVTISFEIFKALKTNPADNLHAE